MRDKFPDLPIVICADDDWQTPGNPGLTKARAAAEAIGGLLAVPVFGEDRPLKATDFNDMAAGLGFDAVRNALAAAKPVADASSAKAESPPTPRPAAGNPKAKAKAPPPDPFEGWPEPQPLLSLMEAYSYPLAALPEILREAVAEVQGFTQAPVALIAGCALSAVSLAAQGLVDVARDANLRGPVGLFFLTVAESGERKSTVDGYFSLPISDYMRRVEREMAGDLLAAKARKDAWTEEYEGLKSALRNAARSGKAVEVKKLGRDMEEMKQDEPTMPRVPRLVYGDITPESLAQNLAKVWPSAGIISSEGGTVLGSHGMNADNVKRNLSLLDTLWSGDDHYVDRKTPDSSFAVRGARLTIGLQVQEGVLRDFFGQSKNMARDTGFLARCLISCPESTQGTRLYKPPGEKVALRRFDARLRNLLETPVELTETGGVSPALLTLSDGAKAAWVGFYDEVERELASGGELADLKDVGSKAAENAARLAALFHCFEGRAFDVPIGKEHMEGAIDVIAWHLAEARHFFGSVALPPDLAAAVKLDAWLLEKCRRERTCTVNRAETRRYVRAVREKKDLEEAVITLAGLDRLQV
jgi:putative DNA primase/helicase